MSMIRLSVYYPSGEGSTFDHDYYLNKHIPLACKAFGVKTAAVDKGLDGPYVASCHFEFDSMEAMAGAMGGPDVGAVMADVANYTNIAPVMQTSEIVQ
jgi:uncharacterized protein (TIGR02118 family)